MEIDFVKIFDVVAYTVLAASTVIALLPKPKEDSVLCKVYKFINMLALNVGKVKAAKDSTSILTKANEVFKSLKGK